MSKTTNKPRLTAWVRSWQAMELFAPPQIPTLRSHSGGRIRPLYLDSDLPWHATLPNEQAAGSAAERYRLYGGLFSIEQLSRRCEDTRPVAEPRTTDPGRGESALFLMEIDTAGRPLPNSLVVSTAPWALARLQAANGELEGWIDSFPEWNERAESLFDRHFQPWLDPISRADAGSRSLDIADLETFASALLALFEIPSTLINATCPGLRLETVMTRNREKDTFLNSLFADPLARLAGRIEQTHPESAIRRLLDTRPSTERIDSRRHGRRTRRLLGAKRHPIGSWPTPGEHALVRSQQLAVNAARETLATRGLFSVNGPPGTGKTTLLRELVASVIVDRARVLAKLDHPANGFKGNRLLEYDGIRHHIALPVPELTGHELVVASSNNGAVENISRILPLAETVAPDWAAGTDYFRDIAERLTGGQRCWGLISAVLGRQLHCQNFIERFWHGIDDTGGGVTFSEHLAQIEANGALDWNRARSNFQQALAHEQHLRDAASRRTGAHIQADNRTVGPDEERASPLMTPDWHTARIRTFQTALQLHQAFIENHQAALGSNLTAMMALLSGRLPRDLDPKIAQALWTSLFLIIPVVSTTLAAFPRLFRHLDAEMIGWLLIDEAGQIPTSHAAPALWCARRAIVVGDPRQLEPIMATPSRIQHALATDDEMRTHFLPGHGSLQTTADRQNPLGAWLAHTEGAGDWVGAPLRVHRRCASPMFEIANEIAYGGLMVHETPPNNRRLPASAWIDVRGQQPTRRNVVPGEIDACVRLIEILSQQGLESDDVFLISPFREVVTALHRMPGHRVAACGTVHTVQGREADVVILVLGGTPGARQWVTSKPNLLNVAVTRARHRLYVIGDKAAWSRLPHAEVLARHLPSINDDKINALSLSG